MGKCGGNFAVGVPLRQQPQWVAVNGCKLLHGLHQVLGLLLINHRIFGNRGRVSIAVKVRFFLAGSILPLSQQQERTAACTADKVSRKLVRVLPVQAGKVFGYVQKYFLRYILSKVRVVDDLAGNVVHQPFIAFINSFKGFGVVGAVQCRKVDGKHVGIPPDEVCGTIITRKNKNAKGKSCPEKSPFSILRHGAMIGNRTL